MTLTGDNGILKRAVEAKQESERAEIIEKIKLDIADKQIENLGIFSREELIQILNKYGTLIDENTLITTKGNYKILVSEIWNGESQESVVEDIPVQDWDYEISGENVILRKYKGENTEINIPLYYKVDGKKYTVQIGQYASSSTSPLEGPFRENTKITKVNFADGITVEGHYATQMFKGCTSLKEINKFPNDVYNIQSAFMGCSSLQESPEIPINVENIDYLFMGCTSITNIPEIPYKVTSMKYTFTGCTNLEGEIVISSADISAFDEAFTGTTKNIKLKVLENSKTYTNFNNASLPSNISIETYTSNIIVSDSYINLSTIYGVVNQEINLFTDSIISNDNPAYTSRFICDYGTMNSEKWTYTPKNADSFKLTAQIVYEPNNTVIESKEVDVIISDIPTANSEIKYLAIGDSTTEAGGYTNRLLTKFNSVIPNITLLGTNGTAPNLHEGRSGWSTKNFRSSESVFYNKTTLDFDFNYYMNKNSYKDLDYVTIGLGINGLFSLTSDYSAIQYISTMVEDINKMISSIHSYDSTIKIGIMITIPPTSNQDTFYNDYGNTQSLERYLRNNMIWANQIISIYGNRTSEEIYIIPTNAVIDRANGFTNGVHPNTTGYNQMGDEIYAWILSTLK